jgi:uncharacterized protein YjbJ (UPF0337 family)
MSRLKGAKQKLAGKSKRLVGEILGDQALDDEGKSQEKQGEELQENGGFKPLGNLDKLT